MRVGICGIGGRRNPVSSESDANVSDESYAFAGDRPVVHCVFPRHVFMWRRSALRPRAPEETMMKATKIRRPARTSGLVLTVLATGVMSLSSAAADMAVKLSGAQEVPPVTTNAAATGNISVADDGMVSGSITTTGIDATAAHVHEGAVGKNGGVIVPLVKNGATFSVPPNAKLTEAQMKAFKAGDLYVNVHSAAHPDGELRAQLK